MSTTKDNIEKEEARNKKQPASEQPSREPFPAVHTPDPPQIMDPSSDHERTQKGSQSPGHKEPAKKEHAKKN
jgi:hypothetical protein